MKIVSDSTALALGGSSAIRKMFEAGIELKKEFGSENVYDFSLGNPDLPPPARAREVLAGFADRVVKPHGLGYMPNAGLPAFRAALAAKLSVEQGIPLEAKHVVVTCGAAGALTAFFRAVLNPGDEIIVPAPYFVEYGAYCGHFGGVLKPVPSIAPEFQPDVAALEAAVSERTRVLIVNSPNNPTGCVYSRETMDAVARMLARINLDRERPVFLLSDEPYRFVAYDGIEVPPVLPITPFSVVLGSFSKSLSLAGERIGYIALNPRMPELDTLLNAVIMTNRTLGFVNAPVLGQLLAMDLINEGVDVSIYARRRTKMAKVLTDAGIRFALPKGAFYFFAEAPGGDDKAFCAKLLKQNVLAVPGSGFGYAGYIRLCFAVEDGVIERSAAAFKRAVAE